MTKSVYGGGPVGMIKRLSLTMAWCGEQNALQEILSPDSKTHFARLFRERPEFAGILVWPYQCATWESSIRLKRLKTHCELVEKLGPPFNIGTKERVILADLSFVREGLRLVLDQPMWFLREGGLVLNLFLDRTRMYSLAFSANDIGGEMVATIGAIQGRSLEEAADEYRLLTKLANGMRPRDLLFEAFCIMCSHISIAQVFAVSNEDRHHVHPFFGGKKVGQHTANYNEIWEDRGGVRIDRSFYQLSTAERRRAIAEIPPRKRAMYRKRYDMMDEIGRMVCNSLEQAKTNPNFAPHEQFDL